MGKNEIIDRVVIIALEQVGTVETPKGSNINKYAKFFDDLRKQGINIYNGAKQGAPWCDLLADYVYIQATSIEVGPKMIYQPFNGCGAGCKFSAEYYRKNKAFYKTPEVGDQIFYGKDGKAGTESHTGIVVKLTEKTIYTVEGNTDDQVKAKTISKNQIGKKIVGFGRPDWSYAVKALTKEETPTAPTAPSKPKETPKPSAPTKAKKTIVAPVVPLETKKSYAKTWTVDTDTDPLRLRKGPGTNYGKIALIPKGAKVTSQGRYTGAWLFVTYETKDTIYKGFCFIKYLK